MRHSLDIKCRGGAVNAHAEWPEQSCSFAHRIPVTISATGAAHAIETKIDLQSSDFPADYVFSTAGDDVRVFASDDITPVDFFITKVQPNGLIY